MSSSWKQMLDQAGDEHLGAALVRWARMAAAVHQGQVAAAMLRDGAVDRVDRIEPASADATVYMEVNR